jgi:type IV pilus assembly protein PilQ
MLSLFAVGWVQAAALKSVQVSRGANESQVVKITLDSPLSGEPMHFSTTNPHRIVLDLADTRGARLSETLDQGVIRSYNVIQAGERTRVVLNLAGPAGYQVRQVGNQLLVVVRGERGAPDAPPPTRFAEVGPKRDHAVKDVEFKRAPSGEGRIIVHLSDPGVGVDIRSRGGSVQVDFLNTALPSPLQRRLDVSDFGTPAQLVETVEQGKNTRMKVDARGSWDYSAYQTGNQFILEIRSLDDPRMQALADKPRYTGEKLTLNFQNVEIRAVLQVIADFTGLNIIASDTVTGNVTLRLKDVPWDQALDIILRAKGLDKRVTGNVIWVAPRDELAAKEKLELEAKQQIADLEPLVTESIPLNYLRANEAEGILMGKSIAALQAGQAVSCEASATGVGGQTQTAATTAGTGQAAQRVLSKRGSVTYDLKTNTLFVQDTSKKLDEVRQLLAKIDVPTRQVMIEARVVIADDKFARNLGVRLGFKSQINSKRLDRTPIGISTTANDAAAVAAGTLGTTVPFNVDLGGTSIGTPGSIGFAIIEGAGNAILGLELQALEADRRGRVVSNPRVVTSNQKPAVILQGEEIPYVTVTNNTTTTQFRNAVLCLLVDPQILNNDNIILDVEVTKDARGESAGTSGFAINKKRVKTQVRVADGETAVLGGIFEQDLKNEVNKIPILGDLPILGHLFRDNYKQDNKTELLIFLTPRILPDNFAAARLQ